MIADSEKLWRHFKPGIPGMYTTDKRTGKPRPSSAVFADRRRYERSVDRAALTTLERSFALKDPGNLIAEVEAGLCRQVGFSVVADPTAQNPAHALICGTLGSHRQNKIAERILAMNSTVKTPPTPNP
jgi:hypothetical protein